MSSHTIADSESTGNTPAANSNEATGAVLPIEPEPSILSVVLDSTLFESSNETTRDQDFWLEYGNIILLSSNIAFRVYKGLLSVHSPVFRDLFSGFSASPHEQFDGCPVVHLQESARNLRYFLRAILHLSQPIFYRAVEDTPKIPIDELLAVARLSHKFQVDGLLSQAISCLQTYYTDRFDVWITRGQFRNVPFETSNDHRLPSYAIGVINLAHLTDTPSMLPLAFYDCISLGGKVAHGWTREDGTVERLSTDDLERCIDGSLAFANIEASVHEVFPGRVRKFDGCLRLVGNPKQPNRQCIEATNGISFALQSSVRSVRGGGALGSYTHIPSVAKCLDKLCQVCYKKAEGMDEEVRKVIWSILPACFRLSEVGWESGEVHDSTCWLLSGTT